MISPGSKQVLTMLAQEGLEPLIGSGARLLECSCGPCIGSGGAPVTSGVSARTFNRNFEGRSGTAGRQGPSGQPLTAAQAALNGKFTDPATWGPCPPSRNCPPIRRPSGTCSCSRRKTVTASKSCAARTSWRWRNSPASTRSGDVLEANVVIRLGDNITTDHIMPAGAEILAPALQYPGHFRARVRARGP